MINLVIKQRIILAHIDGMSNRAIANMLHISKDTVNKYVNDYNENAKSYFVCIRTWIRKR